MVSFCDVKGKNGKFQDISIVVCSVQGVHASLALLLWRFVSDGPMHLKSKHQNLLIPAPISSDNGAAIITLYIYFYLYYLLVHFPIYSRLLLIWLIFQNNSSDWTLMFPFIYLAHIAYDESISLISKKQL